MRKGSLVADREMLIGLERLQVIIAEWNEPLKAQFYYNFIPEISISKCNFCHHVSYLITEDFKRL